MNKRLTDFEETKDTVIGYHRAMRRKPSVFGLIEEEDTVLEMFFEKR